MGILMFVVFPATALRYADIGVNEGFYFFNS